MGNEERFYQELNNVKKQIRKQKDCDLISGAEKERTEKMQNGSKNFMKKLKKFEIKRISHKISQPESSRDRWCPRILDKVKSIDSQLGLTITKCSEEGKTPLTKRRTLLIQKKVNPKVRLQAITVLEHVSFCLEITNR